MVYIVVIQIPVDSEKKSRGKIKKKNMFRIWIIYYTILWGRKQQGAHLQI